MGERIRLFPNPLYCPGKPNDPKALFAIEGGDDYRAYRSSAKLICFKAISIVAFIAAQLRCGRDIVSNDIHRVAE